MNPKNLDIILNKDEASKILQPYVELIFNTNLKIINIAVKPIKTYQDSVSFNLSAIYEILAEDSSKNIINKKVFISADSLGSKENDFEVERAVFNYFLTNPGNIVTIPKPYAFIKPLGLLIRDYVEGELLGDLIKLEGRLTAGVADLVSAVLLDLEKIKIPVNILKNYEEKPSFTDLVNNLEILKNRKHPLYTLVNEEYGKIAEGFGEIKDTNQGSIFSHGDFNPRNLVVINREKVVLFDFDNAGARSYLCDVAGFYSHLGTMVELSMKKEERLESQKIFLDSYLKMKNLKLADRDKKIFELYKGYFDLLTKTHNLVWG